MVTTYIIAGYDWSGGFKEQLAAWEKRAREKGDVAIIRPKAGETMADVAKQIKGSANIIIASHSSQDGAFDWNQYQHVKYSELFKELSREGIQSVTVGGCYGASSLEMMDGLPKGTILQSRVGSKVRGLGSSIGGRFVKEVTSYKEITQLSIILEVLDATDPTYYIKAADEWNKLLKENPEAAKKIGITSHTDLNPNDVLSHTIGIGGHPPIKLDLNEKMAQLSASGKSGKLDKGKFQQAIDTIKLHFDTNNGSEAPKSNGIKSLIGEKTGLYGPKSELDAKIDEVAKKLESGADTSKFTIEEKRIGYALTVSNLYMTGEMDRLVAQGKTAEPVKPRIEPVPTPVAPTIQPYPLPFPEKPKTMKISWNGRGDEETAKLQAIAEAVFHLKTDKGGADDKRVDGVKGDLTKVAIAELKRKYSLTPENGDSELLDKLLHDPKVKAAFGKVGIVGGEEIANVTLSNSGAGNQNKPKSRPI